jgi:hypothetical protein
LIARRAMRVIQGHGSLMAAMLRPIGRSFNRHFPLPDQSALPASLTSEDIQPFERR